MSTGALTVNSLAFASPWMDSHAPRTSIRPEPWACAGTSEIFFAVLVSATRREDGVSLMPCCFAAESSRALAPAACGEDIEVPWSMP